jgi:hypothetical protein
MDNLLPSIRKSPGIVEKYLSTRNPHGSLDKSSEIWLAVAIQNELMVDIGFEPSNKNQKHKRALGSYVSLLYSDFSARKLNMEEAPPSPSKWKAIEQKSIQRQDSLQGCPICRTHFELKDQVLSNAFFISQRKVILSCSHVFHKVSMSFSSSSSKACLSSFERHSQTKVCPICRKTDYHKKSFGEGK